MKTAGVRASRTSGGCFCIPLKGLLSIDTRRPASSASQQLPPRWTVEADRDGRFYTQATGKKGCGEALSATIPGKQLGAGDPALAATPPGAPTSAKARARSDRSRTCASGSGPRPRPGPRARSAAGRASSTAGTSSKRPQGGKTALIGGDKPRLVVAAKTRVYVVLERSTRAVVESGRFTRSMAPRAAR